MTTSLNELMTDGAALWRKRLTHAEHLERCLAQPDRSKWSPGDRAAWHMEEAREDVALALVKKAKSGSPHAIELYSKLIASPEMKTRLEASVKHEHTHGRTVNITLSERIPRQLRAGGELSEPAVLSGPVEGEYVEAESAAR